MNTLTQINKPNKDDQQLAMASYDALAAVLQQMKGTHTEIEIEETQEKIKIPLSALRLLGDILHAMSLGRPFTVAPVAAEVTTQMAAELLGCSRPHIVKLLETGQLSFTKVGKHRRLQLEDVLQYKKQMKQTQKQQLIDLMKSDEEAGLYDS
jgi:excisionase family DNA binding protein